MFGLGAGEVLIILLMGIIFIGPKKLPELAQNIGKMLREFQKTKDSVMESLQNVEEGAGTDDDDSKAAVHIEDHSQKNDSSDPSTPS